MQYRLAALVVALLMALPLPAHAEKRDPLNDKEVDQLRETAQEPEKRLKLMVEFTRARMTSIDQLRADPKQAKDRGQKIHDLLEDIATLVDEIDDNVSDYDQRQADLRKPLQQVVQLDSELQRKLRDLQQSASDPKNSAEDYKFVLQDAVESINQSADSNRKLLDEHNVKFAKKKK
jgi:DNA repair exonuclease SbcCD ATPase subunit